MAKTCLFLLICLLFATCSNKPTLDECRVSLANFLRIQLGKTTTNAEINKLVTEDPISIKMTRLCVKTKTRKQVECEMSAANQQEIAACSRFAKKTDEKDQ